MNPGLQKTFIFCLRTLCTLVLLGWFHVAQAQNSNYLQVKTGWDHIGSRDKGMSPLLYAGSGFFAGLGWDRQTAKHSTALVLDLAAGIQRNKYKNSVDYRRGNLQLTVLYAGKSDKAFSWGWHVNNVFSHRFNAYFVNFKDHYEYFTNVGPAFSYAAPFQFNGREVWLQASAHVQLIGMMIRPSYTSSYPMGFLNRESSISKSLIHSVRVIHPENAFNFGIKPKIVYPLRSGNKITFGYDFEFYQLRSTNTVSQSGGTWYISLAARL
ncbi:MAG TPA: hypothetical protein VK014_09550 [Cyclobacteriaceae bacterium]|nr:hypothetical protein [Cyclobacteriaceae bacterium]